MLELTKKRSKHANLLFLDFAKAYDRVDRKILFQKLRQLNFPESFVRYLEEYYANDFIVTDSTGKRTRKLYLCRGLRQGCPMSAILFAIYVSELGWRQKSRKGIALGDVDNTTVSNLFFADDGILMANFSVDQYNYLGIKQKVTVKRTTNARVEDMKIKAKSYVNAIMRTTKTVPDKSEVLVKMWENVAIPAILYGVEALPTPLDLATELENIQLILGKWILGVPRSTANSFVYLE